MLEFNPKAKKTILLESLLGDLFQYCLHLEIVGSRSLSGIVKASTDYDVLACIPMNYGFLEPLLRKHGWTQIDYGNLPRLGIFSKHVNGIKVDLLLSNSEHIFFKTKAANDLCRTLNLTDKAQRIVVWNLLAFQEEPVPSHKGFSYTCTDPYLMDRIYALTGRPENKAKTAGISTTFSVNSLYAGLVGGHANEASSPSSSTANPVGASTWTSWGLATPPSVSPTE